MSFRPIRLGELVTVRGIECRVYAILPMGTVEVIATDGTQRCFRVSGSIIVVE